MTTAYLCLGGNVGDVAATLAEARQRLVAGGLTVLAQSPLYRTPPWGPVPQPPYLNQVIAVAGAASARALLTLALDVERQLGRDRSREERFGPRTMDIDLLTFGEETIREPDLELPHPRLMERAFALVPLLDIAPEIVIGGKAAKEALAGLDRSGIERVDPTATK
ncbi:2-amino-4-hydroxy-6-hydroxymethyldihydropteridine diphosphokinase [Azorhizobium oxalatiphilum]|uniref:2-amino-4-hydroxy-6-hydroxymethyldihydropteridine pyrophosphokinase n=1 Tax=Azorhizobium oxalatiphilum TaxID=980631 RepID=A0A917C5I5_9HYPH|nr:2-amino-4-hydroxy-6-hydroxymethyldihydropteridine diphosphokinase [Azorhizobium oxalatiphilum]GGF73083.1 2-amino-4-hydroxy-6-hydroxymethyldihydropteridine diphosphokinase [Azorhizobium oxalatiphilum]